MNLVLVGLNHKTAPVEVRERFALADCLVPESEGAPFPEVVPVGGAIREVVVLSTCNRVEIMTAATADNAAELVLEHWAGKKGRNVEELRPYVYIHRGLDAVKHVFTVAASLDSMIVGEPQILGQLKDAYRKAVDRNAAKVILNRLMHKAFSTAKRVRTETEIGAAAVSISYAAVELARRIFGDMGQSQALLVGAGEMAELAAKHLIAAGLKSIFVVNRTFARAEELAREIGGQAAPFESLAELLSKVDVVISSTGAPGVVVKAPEVREAMKRRKNRPMFLIDIAVPRDIDPDVNNLDNVYLYDIDDLKEVVEENLEKRRDEADKARRIVQAETAAFGAWMEALALAPTIKDLLARGEDLGRRELAKTMKRIGPGLDEQHKQALVILVDSVVHKLLSEPILYLKKRHAQDPSGLCLDMTRRLFSLDDTVPEDENGTA